MNPGTQLGPYRVDSKIGAGGMGEVYLATDTRLDRSVAIKILSRELSASAALRERFEREAKAISSLNHPNICALYDVGIHDGNEYLVMEYLQGETLADRIARGALPAEQVLRIGGEIAAALDRAHRQGIVHRDLKPGNVMLTRSGVKLLDFGLAKLTTAPPLSPHHPTQVMTERKPLTEQGAILGTFQYMAPEQLEGREVDARSDIFALGAILYEMATGRRAFDGTSKASIIAAILDHEPPPIGSIQPLAPRALERLVKACMAKDPDERMQTAHDVALELRWIGESSQVSEPVAARRRKRVGPWIVAALMTLVAIAAGALFLRERARPAPSYTFEILPPAGGSFLGTPALSADGKLLAYGVEIAGRLELWLRRLDDGSQRRLAVDAVGVPFWSPDGKWIVYFSNNRIMRVPADGGEPEMICRSNMHGSGDWSEDGTIVFSAGWGVGLARVPATGGDPVMITKLDAARRESYHGNVRFFAPRRYLYVVRTVAEKRNEIWAGDLDGGKPHMVVSADAPVGLLDDHLLYMRDAAIYAQRFDRSRARVEGEPRRIVPNARYEASEAWAAASVSKDGTLVHRPAQVPPILLNVYRRDGTLVRTLWRGDGIQTATLSRDETMLALTQWNTTKGATDVVAVELARGIATPLTSGRASYRVQAISPDGQFVAYSSDREGMYDIYLKSIDGSNERVLWKDGRDKSVTSWFPDGSAISVVRFTPETQRDIWLVPAAPNGKPTLLAGTEANDNLSAFSPDGRWFAYESDLSGRDEVYVRSHPEGRAIRASTEGGRMPFWSRDGRELLWVAEGTRIMAASFDGSGATPRLGEPKPLFSARLVAEIPIAMADGNILVSVPAPDAQPGAPLVVTTAWKQKLDD